MENIEQDKVHVLPDGRLNRANAAKFIGCKPRTLADWDLDDKGPPSRMVGGRRFYHIDDLRAFVAGEAA